MLPEVKECPRWLATCGELGEEGGMVPLDEPSEGSYTADTLISDFWASECKTEWCSSPPVCGNLL